MPTKHNYLHKYVGQLRFSDGCICQFSELPFSCMNDHKTLASNSLCYVNKDGTDEYQFVCGCWWQEDLCWGAELFFVISCCCALIKPSTLTTKLVNSKNILYYIALEFCLGIQLFVLFETLFNYKKARQWMSVKNSIV